MSVSNDVTKTHGFAPINGLKMYYEIEGTGDPIVHVPPAFGFSGMIPIPALVQGHSVITVDLQGNGRTADISNRRISIEQYAEDVVVLLQYLGITKADFFGDSYGGDTVVMIAVRHPELVRRVATYGATFSPPPNALNFTTLPASPPTADSKYSEYWRESYKSVAPDPDYWPRIFEKVHGIQWNGFSNEELASIKAPLLIAVGDHDFIRLEHAVESFRRIPHAELAVIPDASHFVLFSEQDRLMPVVKYFLEKPEKRLPLAVNGAGYQPGETR